MKLDGFRNYLVEQRANITEFHLAVNRAGGIHKLSMKSLEHYMRGRKHNDPVWRECNIEKQKRLAKTAFDAIKKAGGLKNVRHQSLLDFIRNKHAEKKDLEKATDELERRIDARKKELERPQMVSTDSYPQYTDVVMNRNKTIRVYQKFDDVPEDGDGKKFCYLYQDSATGNCKFGTTFVKPGENPVNAIFDRFKQQKTKSAEGVFILNGRYEMKKMWDVSEYAKKLGMNNDKSKMDNVIAEDPASGMPPPISDSGVKSEWYEISADDAIEGISSYLRKKQSPPQVARLSMWQAFQLESTLDAMKNGPTTILADLCPRFGKTLWAASVALETKTPLTVVTSYVLSATSSFANQIVDFKQFKDMVIVDTNDDEYKERIRKALKEGKQVLALQSLCMGETRNDKLNDLLGSNYDEFVNKKFERNKKLLIVDEADYGAHQPNQAEPLQTARDQGKNTSVILMTGSNAERAIGKDYEEEDGNVIAARWHIDKTISTVYPELEAIAKGKNFSVPVKHRGVMTEVDKQWSQSVVPLQAVMLPLDTFMEDTRKAKETAYGKEVFAREYDPDKEPQWTKFARKPEQGRLFFKRLLRTLFVPNIDDEGDAPSAAADLPHLDIENVVSEINADDSVVNNMTERDSPVRAMMFLPGSTRTKPRHKGMKSDFDKIAQYAREALGDDWEVIQISGSDDPEKRSTNAKSESKVKSELNRKKTKKKNVLVLSRGMGARSFSVPDITEVYIAYDRGGAGSTIQKMSRVFTASKDKPNKIGRVFNLSFDPNRDDKFDAYYAKAARNIAERTKDSFHTSIGNIMGTNDLIFSRPGGIIKVTADEYTKELATNDRLHKIIARQSSFEDAVEKLGDSYIRQLIDMNLKAPKKGSQEKKSQGKTWKIQNAIAKARNNRQIIASVQERSGWQSFMERAAHDLQEVIPQVKQWTKKNPKTFEEALDIAARNEHNVGQHLTNLFRYDFGILYRLYKEGIIDHNYASIYERKTK